MNIIIQLAALMPVILITISFLIPVIHHYHYKHIPGICLGITVLNFVISGLIVFK